MAMKNVPAISLASEDPGRADLEYRIRGLTGDLEAHFLTLYNVAEIPVHIRRNSLHRQDPIGVLGMRPVESWPNLVPTELATPPGDAKERDVGGARPEDLQGLRTTLK